MKCGHPMCERGIGLVSYRRGWFGSRRYCSKACRDNYAFQPSRPLEPRASLMFSAAPVRGVARAR
jgi:hypothetical protein